MAIRNKKGVFFTFSAMLLLTLMFTDLFFQTDYKSGDETRTILAKTSNLNSFVQGLEQDVERGLFIAGFRSLIAVDHYIADNNKFVDNAEDSLKDAILNASVEGKQATIMNDSTIPDWLSRIQIESVGVGIFVNFSLDTIVINQSTPWQIDFYISMSYNVTDNTRTAAFYVSKNVSTTVSIMDLNDPLYTIFTGGTVLRAINKTVWEGNYADGLNTSNLQSHINGFYYTNSTGPNYLMRLQGNLSDSSNGIESIVRIPDLEDQGLQVFERTHIDYLYFANSSLSINTINNTFEGWLRLDDGHLEKYQVENLVV